MKKTANMVTAAEAAQIMGCRVQTVWKCIRRGQLTGSRGVYFDESLGRCNHGWLLDRATVEKWAAEWPAWVRSQIRVGQLKGAHNPSRMAGLYSRSQEALDMMKADGVRLPVAAQRLRLKPLSLARHLQRQLKAGKLTREEYLRLREPERLRL